MYKVFYYDDKDFDNNGTISGNEAYTNPAESGYETAAFGRIRGKETGAKAAVLKNDNSAPTTYLVTSTFYDKNYNVIQINKQNHLAGADVTSNAFDFAKRITKNRREHTAVVSGNSKSYTIKEEFSYDHASRLQYRYHQIGTQTKVLAAKMVYDELGRQSEKNLHCSNFNGSALPITQTYLQSLDYTYNIRNWLTGINDITS